MVKTKLYDIADIRPGHPFRGTIAPVAHASAHVVQVRDIDNYNEINAEQLITTKLAGRKQPDWLQTEDILFVAKGAKHFATYVRYLPEYSVCSPHFFIVRLHQAQKKHALPEFISWQLNQLPAQRYFKNSAEGSLYVSIRRKILEDTPITLPPIATQKQIVSLHRAAIKEQKILHQLINNRQQQLKTIASKIFSD
ncbi:type I restriction endonuclease subunit S [Methylococcaceae bacterium HT4]|nr:type I restriction endonuclease subunit S [Methylococcaceae bacterium CS5]TXK97561.1 type I restriction endonuclease subunit S [Methylococcaceae bacterium CS4]TXL04418.1 type I restriction endonuclease subunit S [Methylococcaceae bacterium CS3]TXL04991.1 type I restriction endonuclease subunit S [Methylococcaceae bacterium CS1]TXL09778.1 type I restriction endonuclease subunit S [Methylococcaceae bacterium CS2]TXL15174.1 type I restriction endonuclease subunit S [Methylococcaceae bacterium 